MLEGLTPSQQFMVVAIYGRDKLAQVPDVRAELAHAELPAD